MAINVIDKGKTGEREIATMLREIVASALRILEIENHVQTKFLDAVQRNMNQSAVGGCDIKLFGIAFEVKRQETLSVKQWWNQCLISASRNNHIPVLLYRQNRKPWNIMLHGLIGIPGAGTAVQTVATINEDDFRIWFFNYCLWYIKNNQEVEI